VSGEVWVSPQAWRLINPYFKMSRQMPDKFVLLKPGKALEPLRTRTLRRLELGSVVTKTRQKKNVMSQQTVRSFSNILDKVEAATNRPVRAQSEMAPEKAAERTTLLTHTQATEEAANLVRSYVPGAVLPILRLGVSDVSEQASVQLEQWGGNELREVTVMFVNLGLKEHDLLAAAAYNDAVLHVHRVLRAVQKAIYAYEGSINKFLMDDKGSTLIAVFGLLPLVHEDDATRAVLASLLLCQELGALRLTPSIGITTGTAFCGIAGSPARKEYTVLGDVVNLSARLMQRVCQTGCGGVLCSKETRNLLPESLHVIDKGKIKVKGKEQLIHIFQPHADFLGREEEDGPSDEERERRSASLEECIDSPGRTSLRSARGSSANVDNCSAKRRRSSLGKRQSLKDRASAILKKNSAKLLSLRLLLGDAHEANSTPFHRFFSFEYSHQLDTLQMHNQANMYVFPPKERKWTQYKSERAAFYVRKIMAGNSMLKTTFKSMIGIGNMIGNKNDAKAPPKAPSTPASASKPSMVSPLFMPAKSDGCSIVRSTNGLQGLWVTVPKGANDDGVGTLGPESSDFKGVLTFHDLYMKVHDTWMSAIDSQTDTPPTRSAYRLVVDGANTILPDNANLSVSWLPSFIPKLGLTRNLVYRRVGELNDTQCAPASEHAFVHGLEKVCELIETGNGGGLVISGGRGSGKSFFLKRFVSCCCATQSAASLDKESDTTIKPIVIGIQVSAYERGNPYVVWARIMENMVEEIYTNEEDVLPSAEEHVRNMLQHNERFAKYTYLIEDIFSIELDLVDFKQNKNTGTPAELDQGQKDTLMFDMLLFCLNELLDKAASRRCVICIDDAHFMNEVSWGILYNIVHRNLPCLVLASVEPMAKSRDRLLQPCIPQVYTEFVCLPSVMATKMGVATPRQIQTILFSFFDCAEMEQNLSTFFVDNSIGNPKTALEMAGALLARGFIVVSNGAHSDSGDGGGTKQLSRVHWSEDGLKASVDERLQCTFYSSWIRGSRYMTLDRLHVLQQQVIKMAAGVADIKRSHQQYNSASLRGYFFPLEHLEAACPIEDLKADLEGVADSLEESGIFCKAMDVRTNKVTYTFMDPYLCLAARSRCTAIVQQELAEKVKELEREREESLRAMFMQKTVGLALEQNATPIEVEILKSSAKRSVFKAAAGQNWKTRHVRVKDNEFQVLKSGSVIQSCPIRNVTVERLQPEALKVPLDGRKFLVRVYATGHWLEKGKTQTGTKEFLLSLPDATAVEKITFWINSVKKKLSIEGRTGRSGRTGSVLAYKKKSKRRSMLDMIDETPEEESDPSIITMQIVLLSAENLSCSRHFTLGNYHRVYCVMHMDNYVVDTVGGQAPTRTVFSRLSKSDSNFNRNFTAVSSTCEWNVNLYFPVPKHKLGRSPSEVGAPPSERVSFLLGRVWERNFFGDDQFLGQFVLPVSELNRNDPGHVYSVELVGRDANEASLGTLRLSCSFTGTLVDGFEFYRIADSPVAIQKLQQPHDDDGSKWELKYTLWHEGSIPQVSNYSSKKLTKTKEGEFMVKSQERVEDEGAGVNDVPRDTSTPRLSIVKEDEEDEEVGTEGTEASSDGIATNEKTASATKEGPAAATSSPGERSKPSRMQRIVIAMKAENDRIKILNDFVEFCTLKSEKRGEQEGDNTSPATLPIDDMKEWVKRFRASRNVTGGGGAGK
jgi:class 3 adenylate cyclase